MNCAYCKSRVLQTDRKCPSCGSTVFLAEEPERGFSTIQQPEPHVTYQTIHQTIYVQEKRSVRNRWLALLLCFFGGVIGLHRFYVGKMGTGLLYLFTGGVFGVGAFVDFCSILFGNFRDARGLRLSSGKVVEGG